MLNYPSDCIDCEVWTAITYFWILSINLRFPTVNYTRPDIKKKKQQKKTRKNAVPLRNSVNVLVTLKNPSITSCSNESLPSHMHEQCVKSSFA